MLTVTTARSARIDVASNVIRLAFRYVADGAGWTECSHQSRPCGCTVVSDRVPAGCGDVDVLIVQEEPAACQDAVKAAVEARVRAVVLGSAPEDLRSACEGMDRGLTVIPRQVIELGALAPQLTDRQREVLRLLARGSSSGGIAGALRQSESTAKRDIAELLQVFDVPNRTALISTAASFGFVNPRVLSRHGVTVRAD